MADWWIKIIFISFKYNYCRFIPSTVVTPVGILYWRSEQAQLWHSLSAKKMSVLLCSHQLGKC